MALRHSSRPKRKTASKLNNLLAVTILSGSLIICAFLITNNRKDQNINEEPDSIVAEYKTIDVPVPEQYVEAGTKLKDIQFKNISFPENQLPQGVLLDLNGLENAEVIAPLPANLPLFPENLNIKGGYINPVIERIPQGMRAITIRVDATTVVEGWASTGAIIDVLLVEDDRTTVVSEKVKILSVERSIKPVSAEENSEIPSTVTLLVSQEQALAINTAIPRGRITFALRGFQDGDVWRDRVYTSDRFNSRSSDGSEVAVKGYVSVKNGRAFSLADDKWIVSEAKPQGFFVNN
jgi:Flp pilus assembly protein CpaB